MATLNFDANTVAPDTGALDPVPAGWYIVQIDESEMRPTKDGNGSYLRLRFNVIEGQYAGRKLFHNLNLVNANPQAVEIAYRQLSAICHATGVIQVQDSQQLHGIPLKVKVRIRPAKDGYEAQNELVSFANVNEGGSTAPAAPAAPAANTAPSWQQPAAQQPWQQPQQAAQPSQAPTPAPTPAAPAQGQQAPQQAPQQQAQQPQQQAAQQAQPSWAANQDPQDAPPPWARG